MKYVAPVTTAAGITKGERYEASIAHAEPTVLRINFDVGAKGEGESWEQWLLLLSDAHADNRDSDRQLLKKHLKQADERGAIKLSIGDFFCAMQGKLDKRSDMRELAPDLAEMMRESDAYGDALIKYNANFLEPHLDNFLLFSEGNHETAFRSRNAMDLTSGLCRELKARTQRTGAPYPGTYWGWVWFNLKHHTRTESLRLLYFHGTGGGAPVTKGIIDANRWWVMVDNADIICMGHNHRKMDVPDTRIYLDRYGIPQVRRTKFLRLGGYTQHFLTGRGWESEKGMGAKPLGAWWLRLYMEDTRNGLQYDVIEAH